MPTNPHPGATGLQMPSGTEPRSAALRRIAPSLPSYRKLGRAAREELARLPEPALHPSLPDSQVIFRDVEEICARSSGATAAGTSSSASTTPGRAADGQTGRKETA